MKQFSKAFYQAANSGKLPELIEKVKLIRTLCEELKQHGLNITIKEEFALEDIDVEPEDRTFVLDKQNEVYEILSGTQT